MHLFHSRQSTYNPFQLGLLLHPAQAQRHQLKLTMLHVPFSSTSPAFPTSLSAHVLPSRSDSRPALMNFPRVSCLAGYPIVHVPIGKRHMVPWRQTRSKWKAVQGRKDEPWKEGNSIGSQPSKSCVVCMVLRYCNSGALEAQAGGLQIQSLPGLYYVILSKA